MQIPGGKTGLDLLVPDGVLDAGQLLDASTDFGILTDGGAKRRLDRKDETFLGLKESQGCHTH